MIVLKFGGTSVGDAAAISRAAGIVQSRAARQPIVVVSALAGTTNALIAMAEQAAQGQLIGALRGVETLRERHLAVSEELLGSYPESAETVGELSATFDELASLAEALSVLGHLTPHSLDAIAAKGEELSSTLVVAAFRAQGIPAELVEARSVMITGEQHGKAEPRTERIAEASQRVFRPLVAQGRVPVVGGFVGATEQGVVTTLGRGGSDFSASLLGAALGAEAIEIWTDVDGMLTGDPRVVRGARLIERIRFDEASELASFGAKVLHPSTIAPAVRLGIPVRILNSCAPQGAGTLITFDAPQRAVTAIAGKEGVTVVKVRSPRMLLAHGFLRSIFEIFDRHRTSVDVVATSEISVSLTIDDARHLDSLVVDLSQLGDVSVERNRGIVALVGAGLAASGAAMSRALAALGSTRVHMLSLSASGINLTMLVDADRVAPAMQALHDAFFSGASGTEAA
ncbi:MAG TPA: lysine-sensitive aspartokinase 3 [Gemmatimonadaceae bacterium]|nr:lysine-sensitive aspartokinase 3 [Gemmatimonadaceae bacterium]